MKVFIHYQDNDDSELFKTLKITLPKSWKNGPTSKLLAQFVESYNANEVLGSKNALKEEEMHLEVEEEGIPIASDAITLEVIPDRANVYVKHGTAPTLLQLKTQEEEENARKKQQAAENASLINCKHFGCRHRFPKGGPYPSCQYHKSPPVFHETAKFWSCCPGKKAYDWDDFQQIPGCQTGVCTEVAEDENEKQFLGGCDLREQNQPTATKLKSIDDFNKSADNSNNNGGSQDLEMEAPVLERLQKILEELGVEKELYDQVVQGLEKEAGLSTGGMEQALGEKLKASFKAMAVEQLRIK